MVERLAQAEIGRRHGHARRHLHAALARQQRPHIGDHAIVTAAAALGGAQPVMNVADAVEADRHGKAVAFEELAIVGGAAACRWS